MGGWGVPINQEDSRRGGNERGDEAGKGGQRFLHSYPHLAAISIRASMQLEGKPSLKPTSVVLVSLNLIFTHFDKLKTAAASSFNLLRVNCIKRHSGAL